MIKLEDFYLSYGGNKILEDINCEISSGEITTIMGGNGCGKTSLLQALSGIIPKLIDAEVTGKIDLAGMNPLKSKVSDIGKILSYCMQDSESQFFTSTVGEELELNLVDEIDSSMKKTGLDKNLLEHDPFTLSEGEKKLLSLCLCLSQEKRIILLDEPFSGLDVENKTINQNSIKKIASEGKSIIIIDHDIKQVKKYSDRLIIIGDNTIVFDGKPNDIIEDDYFLKKYGITPQNFIFKNQVKKTEGPKILNCEKIGYKPEESWIFRNVDFSLKKGEIYILSGGNGTGKTSLLKMLNRINKADEGIVFLEDKDINKLKRKDISKKIGLVFQNPNHQIFNTTVRSELHFTLKAIGIKNVEKKTLETLKFFNLSEFSERNPHTLSHGEKQKVALASVWACNPHILVLDEPETGLDYFGKKLLINVLDNVRTSGKSAILVSHNPEIQQIGDTKFELERCNS